MSIIADALRQGLDVLKDAAGSTSFIWKGVAVPCIRSTFRDGNKPAFGGFDDLALLRVIVSLEEWVTFDSTLITMDSTLFTMDNDRQVPVVGREVTFNGRAYRITEAITYHGDDAYSLRLEPK